MNTDEFILLCLLEGLISVDAENGVVYGSKGQQIGYMDESRGYVRVNLIRKGKRKQVQAHRIIYLSVHLEIEAGHVIDHKDNDKSNNRISNLQSMLQVDNTHKAYDDGLFKTGSSHGRAKIDPLSSFEMALLYVFDGVSIPDIAKQFEVHTDTVKRHLKIHLPEWK